MKKNDYNKTFNSWLVIANGFSLNHDKRLQKLLPLCKAPSKNKTDFLKDVEGTVINNNSNLFSLQFKGSGSKILYLR